MSLLQNTILEIFDAVQRKLQSGNTYICFADVNLYKSL